jgi:uncharacterized protein YjiS (DUF1127 family)
MTTNTITRHGLGNGSALRVVPKFFGQVVGGVANYVNRVRAERQLQALDDRVLEDIGVARSDIRCLVWGSKSR